MMDVEQAVRVSWCHLCLWAARGCAGISIFSRPGLCLLQVPSCPKPANSTYLSEPSQRSLLPALLLAHSVRCRPQRSLPLTGPEGMLNALEIVYLMAIHSPDQEVRPRQALGSHHTGRGMAKWVDENRWKAFFFFSSWLSRKKRGHFGENEG